MDLIRRFLSIGRIAVIGVSREKKDFTRTIWNEFRKRSIEAIPVHPARHVAEGIQCVGSVKEIHPGVDAALILVGKSAVLNVVSECADAGVRMVWLSGVRGPADISEEAARFCRERGLQLIAGYCPMMFLSGASWFHRLHGTVAKVLGSYPR